MHDPAVRVRRADLDHAHRRGRGIALGVAAGDEQLLPDLQLGRAREVVPGLQVLDGDLVSHGDGPEGLPGLDFVVDPAIRIRRGDLDRDDDLRDARHAAGLGGGPAATDLYSPQDLAEV